MAEAREAEASGAEDNSEGGLSLGRKFLLALVITALVVGFEFSALSFGPFENFENVSWDIRLRALSKRAEPHPDIKIITIDQKSLEYAAQENGVKWIWPRDMYEPILLYLKEAGAKAVAFDILFTESTNHSYQLDLSFAKTVAETLPVVSAVVLSKSVPPEKPETVSAFHQLVSSNPATKELQALNNEVLSTLPRYPKAALPYVELIEASHLVGSVTGEGDEDGVFRRTSIGGLWSGKDGAPPLPVLNLPFALYAASHDDISSVIARVTQSLDKDGRLRVGFLGPQKTIPTYPFAAVLSSFYRINEGLEPSIPLAEFKDSLVFVGMTAPGLKNLRPTPLSKDFPGVEFNATVLDNIMNNRFVTPLSKGMNVALSTLLVLCVVLITLFGSNSTTGVTGFSIFASGYTLLSTYLAYLGIWAALFMPIVSMILALSLALAIQYHFEGRKRAFLRSAFGHFVSPDVVRQIVENPDRLSLGGERREISIFFSDIAGFTSLSEHLEPGQLVAFLNEYLTALTDIVLESGGTLDEYEGDAIIAFWNAPIAVEDHAKKCVQTALDCQARLEQLRFYFDEQYGFFPSTRIGINTGTVTVGNFGSHSRFDYTMIGDSTNLAARLEGVNKVFGTNIIVSHYTYEQIKDSIPCRKLGVVRVVGKNEPITLYEPLQSEDEKERWKDFEIALKHFEEGGLDEAAELFARFTEDPVSATYVKRISSERATAMFAWEPIWNLTSK